jgi:hypothetical protein
MKTDAREPAPDPAVDPAAAILSLTQTIADLEARLNERIDKVDARHNSLRRRVFKREREAS